MDGRGHGEFIAIRVGQGDAFYLERNDATVLVDGGRSMELFPAQFHRATAKDSVGILVCTHNDSDHANGVLGYLLGGLAVEETWLPGSWTDRLEDILLSPAEFADELAANIGELPADAVPDGGSLERLGDMLDDASLRRDGDSEELSTSSLLETLEASTEVEVLGDLFWSLAPPHPSSRWPYFRYALWRILKSDSGRLRLFSEAIAAANRIREITIQAFHSGSVIRWFEYHHAKARGGLRGVMEPVNAREIGQFRRRRLSALQYLAITVANSRSLVFFSPGTDGCPGVLFTADSDLSFAQPIPLSEGMIITAPHHGSESNAMAYPRLVYPTERPSDTIWVRSDGRFRARPGGSYLALQGRRYCTICRIDGWPRQDVRLLCSGNGWQENRAYPCLCQ